MILSASMSKLLIFSGIFLLTTSFASSKQHKRSPGTDQERPEAILAAAKKISESRAWRVDAQIVGDKDMKISGIVFGNDFDLTTETVDGTKRQITLGGSSWISDDGGKNWKKGEGNDRRSYYLVHTPIKFSTDQEIPPHEKVAPEKGETENSWHVRFKSPEKIHYQGDRPNWWIALENGKPTVIRRYHGPGVLEGASDYVTTDATYTEIADQPPVVAPPGNPHAAAGEAGPESLLMAAMKKMNSGTWEVKGTISSEKTINLHGLLDGQDFDLTMEPGLRPDVPMRGIVIKNEAWVCSDGKTWHPGTPDDRLLYNWTHTPIMSGRLEPPFEKIGTEQRGGATWLHIQLKVPEKNVDPKSMPQYWLVLDSQGQAQYISHADIPMFSRGSTDVVHCSLDYAPAKEKIAPPKDELVTLGQPVDDKLHGFSDIEAHKLDWAGKIVHLEVEPKLLQSAELETETYQAFLEDTAKPNHYGVVEFPGDALVKLGFLKKTVNGKQAWNDLEKMGALGRTEGQPVSFYVQIIFLGERPAARCIAVGSKFSRGSDGKISYTW